MDTMEVRKIKKGELHVHLNGLVSTDVMKELIYSCNTKVSSQFNLDKDLTIRKPAGSLKEYLKPWELLRLVPINKIGLHKIIESAFINLSKENIQFVELRNSVIYIAQLNKIPVSKALEWLLMEIEACSAIYNIKAGLILTVSRSDHALNDLQVLLAAYKDLEFPPNVVGLDLAGDEAINPSSDIKKLFCYAKHEYGLGITIHAGETGNYHNIKDAIINYDADRIGHGTAVTKSQELMDLVNEKGICIEVCPISNRLTSSIKLGDPHPVIEMIKNDIPFVICSDNPSVQMSCLSDEYMALIKETNSIKCIDKMYEMQKKYSFIEGVK